MVMLTLMGYKSTVANRMSHLMQPSVCCLDDSKCPKLSATDFFKSQKRCNLRIDQKCHKLCSVLWTFWYVQCNRCTYLGLVHHLWQYDDQRIVTIVSVTFYSSRVCLFRSWRRKTWGRGRTLTQVYTLKMAYKYWWCIVIHVASYR